MSVVRERRKEPRSAGGGMRARARPGHRLVVIDVSPRGALVEAMRPLRPGSHLEVQLESSVRSTMLRARVLRCAVAALDASGVTYRAALAFSESCDWLREATTPTGNALP
ncbi:MAG TPA: hypothetical protein VN716_12945 [Vicinamibacterales bacterium]|nr:hypothetical protein [Vicinamibacterales bacterium]